MDYVFEHIPKTGGTTLKYSYLPTVFPPDQLLISDSPDKDLSLLTPERRTKLKVVIGHRAQALRPLFPEARWLTLVRKPVDRAISVYLHARYHRDAWDLVGREVTENDIDLKEFVKEDLFFKRGGEPGSMRDQQARILLGADYDPCILDDKQALTALVRSRFHLCGCTESFEMFLFLLHLTDGWPLVLFTNRLVRKERLTFRPDAAALAEIERCNRADAVVYDCIRKEFDSRTAAVWTADVSRRWDAYICALQKFRAEAGQNEFAGSLLWTDPAARVD